MGSPGPPYWGEAVSSACGWVGGEEEEEEEEEGGVRKGEGKICISLQSTLNPLNF